MPEPPQNISGKVEKAKIHVLDDNDKAKETFEVMFNPSQYSCSMNISFKGDESRAGDKKKTPTQRTYNVIPQLDTAHFGDFTVELFFDSYEEQADVREDHLNSENKNVTGTKKIFQLASPSEEGKHRSKAPVCFFEWGKFYYKGIITNVEQTFTMFLSDGIPVRANVRVSMRPVVDAQEMLKLKGISDSRRARIVRTGDRLDIIAAEELKDPYLWRKIAEANNILNPISFPAPGDIGKTLIIPE